MSGALFTTAYMAPIHYYAQLIRCDKAILEVHEHYSKQSYRNRCDIIGANGIQHLIIPIKKACTHKIKTKDVRIDYDTPWQHIHLRAIRSAYASSPFYLYYIDDFMRIIEKKHEWLLDLNNSLHKKICDILNIAACFTITEDYSFVAPENFTDLRESIHPKPRMQDHNQTCIIPQYRQVFHEKHGFQPMVSIFDVICNEGPNAKNIVSQTTFKI